ncbi:MAG: molybdenum cofactor guanylyltransferase, partial [Caldanaerobacter sp.]
ILSIFPHIKKWLLLLACDIPFFKREVLEFMWGNKEDGKACVIETNEGLQPFLAFYPKEVFPFWKESYEKGERRLQKILEVIPKKVIKEEEIKKFDPSLLSLININYQKDLAKVKEILNGSGEKF